jgi:16S rRNA (uracil1498-N3)-methyltransferase
VAKGRPYFYVEAPGERVELTPEDASHARGPLRIRPGDHVTVSDGAGWVGRGTLGDGGVVEVGETRQLDAPRPRVRVAFAPPSGDRAWWALQKLTEVGVDAIALVRSERSVRKAAREDQVIRRATAVAREAAKQSRRAFLPVVEVHDDGGLFAGAPGDERALVLYEEAGTALRACLLEETRGDAEPMGLYIGPEGGLGERDLAEARERGAVLASLGEPNLRTETAALVAATITLSRYGRLG